MNWITLLAVAAISLGGCAKPRTPPPSAGGSAPQMASDATARVQTLSRLADTFARTSNQLPGQDSADHRRLMAYVFAQLEEILPNLAAPNQGAEFREQMQTIRDSQGELATGPQDLSPEPTIDTGLRAVRDALAATAQAGFYSRSELATLFDQLGAKINNLDSVRGPLHQLVVGEAVGLISQIISKMADVIGQRLAVQNGPVPPAPQPATTGSSGK